MKTMILGLMLVFAAAGGAELMPPTAGLFDWLMLTGIGFMGLLAAAFGALDLQDQKV